MAVRKSIRSTTTAWAVALATAAGLASPAWSNCSLPPANQRAPHPFEADGQVVHEESLGLTWQRCSVGQQSHDGACSGTPSALTWADAGKAAAASGGWRLPTSAELARLVLSNCSAPATDGHYFPGISAGKYWTSNTDGTAGAWFVDFGQGGGNGAMLRTDTAFVLLVRNGGGH